MIEPFGTRKIAPIPPSLTYCSLSLSVCLTTASAQGLDTQTAHSLAHPRSQNKSLLTRNELSSSRLAMFDRKLRQEKYLEGSVKQECYAPWALQKRLYLSLRRCGAQHIRQVVQ